MPDSSINSIARVQSHSREQNQLQNNILKSFNQIRLFLQNTFLNGKILESISLVAGNNTINHTLNRPLQGWVMTRVRAAATFYDNQDTNANPSVSLIINSSGTVTVDIHVF